MWANEADYIAWSRKWLLEAKRILKNNGILILWGGVGLKPLMCVRLAIMIEDEQIFTIRN